MWLVRIRKGLAEVTISFAIQAPHYPPRNCVLFGSVRLRQFRVAKDAVTHGILSLVYFAQRYPSQGRREAACRAGACRLYFSGESSTSSSKEIIATAASRGPSVQEATTARPKEHGNDSPSIVASGGQTKKHVGSIILVASI